MTSAQHKIIALFQMTRKLNWKSFENDVFEPSELIEEDEALEAVYLERLVQTGMGVEEAKQELTFAKDINPAEVLIF